MAENDVKVSVDPAVLMAARIERELSKCEGKYKINQEVYRRVLDLYEEANFVARDGDGKIVWAGAEVAKPVKIIIDVLTITVNGREATEKIESLVGKADRINFLNIRKGDGVRIAFYIDGLWEVCADE